MLTLSAQINRELGSFKPEENIQPMPAMTQDNHHCLIAAEEHTQLPNPQHTLSSKSTLEGWRRRKKSVPFFHAFLGKNRYLS